MIRMLTSTILLGLSLLVLAVSPFGSHMTIQSTAKADTAKSAPLADTMNRVMNSISYLLPYSYRAALWSDKAIDEEARAHLNVLVESASQMEQHGDLSELEKRFMSRSFSKTVFRAEQSFDLGSSDWAWYSMLDLVDHCAACHRKTAGATGTIPLEIADTIKDKIDDTELGRAQWIQILVATRQFQTAMQVLEDEFADSERLPVDLELTGMYEHYIELALVTDGGLERATVTIGKLLARSDLPYYLRERMMLWRDSLDLVAKDRSSPPSLQLAYRYHEQATALNKYPGAGDGMVMDLAAAQMLRQLIETDESLTDEQVADAYFTLGLVSLRKLRINATVPEMELLLQASIETAPKGAHAKNAYALLEEFGFVHGEMLQAQLGTAKSAVGTLIDIKHLAEIVGIEY